MRICWCGSADFIEFSPAYQRCSSCNTLISQQGLADEELKVHDDEANFYGKQYWLNHQAQDLNQPDIYERARHDLTERNLHWLATLLKYQTPPAKVLEIGCSHGSFVALLRQVGYEASGVEMSPWVVDFGHKTFDVPLLLGPVENTELTANSFDVIVLMDVLEHLPDPMSTMKHCLHLLKSDGILLIQTPHFKDDMQYTTLLENQSPFLIQLKSDEHLYLFTESSVTQLFQELGADYIQFEPAIFSHYDMFCIVSRTPLNAISIEQGQQALLASPEGRLALALLDIRARELQLTQQLAESEADRAARLEHIVTLTELVKKLERQESFLSRLQAKVGELLR